MSKEKKFVSEFKCGGNRYNFKIGNEWCQNRHECPFYTNNVYSDDGRTRIEFPKVKDFRNCKLHNHEQH